MAEKKAKGPSFWLLRPFAVRQKPQGEEPPKSPEGEVSTKPEKSLTFELGEDLTRTKHLKCASRCLVIIFSVITVVTAVVAIALIAVSTMSAIAASALDTQDTSGRLVALIVLVVTAAVAVAVIVYAQLAICTRKIRPIFVAAVVLTILAVLQAIIAGAAVRVTNKDKIHITEGLAESFQLAKQHSPRHVKLWASTQNSLQCCGMYSPFDYRAANSPPYVAPDVPVSCCPSYDPDRSELVQERDREICKARNEYSETGCSGPVLEVITETSHWAFTVAITLVVLEILAAISGAFVVKKRKEFALQDGGKSEKKEDPEANEK